MIKCSYLLDLPPEILVQALKNVDGQTLVRCRSVCSKIKNLIEYYTELQYTIQLFVDGMVDGPTSALTAADRLALLLDRRKAWALLQWKNKAVVPMLGPCQAYELVGGVFAKTMSIDDVPYASRHIITSWLPTSGRNVRTVVMEDLGISTRDFAIDPSQDLIIFLEAEDESAETQGEITIHIRNIRTKKPHDAAALPIIRRPIQVPVCKAHMQIADDVIGVFLCTGPDAGSPRLIIWNWRDGVICVDISETHLPPDTYDFSFLSSETYALTCRANNGSIEIFKFDNPCIDPEMQGHSTPLSHHVVSLCLPEINIDMRVVHILIHTGPFEAFCAPEKPFTTSPDCRIYTVSVLYGSNQGQRMIFPARFTIFIHNRAILRYTSAHQQYIQHSSTGLLSEIPRAPLVVYWNDWGPKDTRFFGHGIQLSWLRYVHGQRVVCPSVTSSSGRHRIKILDFNQYAFRAHLFEYLLEEDDQELGSIISNSLKIEPTFIQLNGIFKEVIETSLPYYLVTRKGLDPYSGFMIDEERLVGLRHNAVSNENLEDLHVFMF